MGKMTGKWIKLKNGKCVGMEKMWNIGKIRKTGKCARNAMGYAKTRGKAARESPRSLFVSSGE